MPVEEGHMAELVEHPTTDTNVKGLNISCAD
jgi:hypothetical protein